MIAKNKWKKVFIPEVLFFQEGPGVRNTQFRDSGVKLLNVGNINNGVINLESTKTHLSEEEAFGKYSHFLVDDGDLLIACSGIIVNNFHNKIAFASSEHLPLCLNTSTMRFKPLNNESLNIIFFKYYLQSEYFKSQLVKLITGSAQLNFGPSHIKKIQIPLPPLPTQQKIASILDAADTLRQKDKALLAKYDELTQALFLDMFGDPVRNEKGWEKVPTITYCDSIVPGRDKPKSFSGGMPWITTADLKHLGKFSKSRINLGLNSTEITEVRAKVIPNGSVIMTCVGDLGVISINEEDVVMNQQLHAFICHHNLNNVFLMYNLSYQKPYMYKMASSTTVPYMNKTVANNTPSIVPPINLQIQFAERVTIIEQQKEIAQASLEKSEELFNSLLQKAFKGELV